MQNSSLLQHQFLCRAKLFGSMHEVICSHSSGETIQIRIVQNTILRLLRRNEITIEWTNNWISLLHYRMSIQFQRSVLQSWRESMSKPLRFFKCSESYCRKIAKIDGKYSLPSKFWHEKMISLKALEQRLDGKTQNDGNICRTARRHHIENPCELNRQQIQDLYKIVYHRKKTIARHSQSSCKKALARNASSSRRWC